MVSIVSAAATQRQPGMVSGASPRHALRALRGSLRGLAHTLRGAPVSQPVSLTRSFTSSQTLRQRSHKGKINIYDSSTKVIQGYQN